MHDQLRKIPLTELNYFPLWKRGNEGDFDRSNNQRMTIIMNQQPLELEIGKKLSPSEAKAFTDAHQTAHVRAVG